MNKQPEILVGIMAEPTIRFELNGEYHLPANLGGTRFSVRILHEELELTDENGGKITAPEFIFKAVSNDSSFLLNDVTIGIDFHWEQKQDQQFRGNLKFVVEGEKVRAINVVPLEEYLRSVISSEMSATSSPELLKAHAVISRSWLMAQILKSLKLAEDREPYETNIETNGERVRWYDREDHQLFDVCADDHCQRYQGITKIISDKASAAIEATFGEFLSYEDEICDARFSKCCGGVSENFENVWEPVHHAYLSKVADSEKAPTSETDLRNESDAEHWIRTSPEAFCNTSDKQVLSQVLPDFDQKTQDFYRWKITFSQEELSTLIHRKTGIDFGQIVSLTPLSRGYSGRIIRLKITGTQRTMIIGKELEIRRALSPSHLYSSAFVVDHLEPADGIPQQFRLTGAGWGHGVGLCQIGAAVMGEKGYNYKQILEHYFHGAELVRLY